jgi:hypothetical protein
MADAVYNKDQLFLNKLISLDSVRKTWKLKLEVVAELA